MSWQSSPFPFVAVRLVAVIGAKWRGDPARRGRFAGRVWSVKGRHYREFSANGAPILLDGPAAFRCFFGSFSRGGYPRGRSGHPREPCRARDRFLEHFWSLPGLPLGALGLPCPPHRPHFSLPGPQKVDYGAPPWRGAVKRRSRGAKRRPPGPV